MRTHTLAFPANSTLNFVLFACNFQVLSTLEIQEFDYFLSKKIIKLDPYLTSIVSIAGHYDFVGTSLCSLLRYCINVKTSLNCFFNNSTIESS